MEARRYFPLSSLNDKLPFVKTFGRDVLERAESWKPATGGVRPALGRSANFAGAMTTETSATLPAAESVGAGPAPGRLLPAIAALVAAFAVHFAIQSVTRALQVYPALTADPLLQERGSWLHYVNHHTVQMLLALALIGLLGRGRFAAWGLNLRNAGESWRLLTRGFFPILLVTLLAGHALVPLLTATPPARFAEGLPRPVDLAGMLFFSFLLVGLSEEIVFRGLFQTALARFWRGSVRIAGVEVPTAGLWAAVIFTIAHVSFVLAPPWIAQADPRQLVLAFVLGIYYARAYRSTGSLLAPVLAHNAVNGGILAVEVAVAAAMR